MMDVKEIVRPIGTAEVEAYLAHMERLDGSARALRFVAGVDDHFLLSHCLHMVVARTSLIGAFVDEAMRGAAELEVDDDGQTAELFLHVEKPYRGRGLGRRLATVAMAEATRRRIALVRLDVDAGNSAMRRIAESCGFTIAEGGRTLTYTARLIERRKTPRPPATGLARLFGGRSPDSLVG